MSERVSVYGKTGPIRLYVSDCPNCGVIFGITEDYEDRRRADAKGFYCPNGHVMSWSESEADRQRKRADQAESRRKAAEDQARAAIREAEQRRTELLKIQHRIANGVCPCCNRSFDNVRRHITSQHPEFDPGTPVKAYVCSCGNRFENYRGLRIHQGHLRKHLESIGESWDDPGQGRYWSHLTVVTA